MLRARQTGRFSLSRPWLTASGPTRPPRHSAREARSLREELLELSMSWLCDRHGEHRASHVAQHTTDRCRAIDARTTRYPGYATSRQKRMLVEQGLGWMKRLAARAIKVDCSSRGSSFHRGGYNIVRLRRLLEAPAMRTAAGSQTMLPTVKILARPPA
jgi:hypothetical protein